jgi:hypothetical protein
MACAITSLMRHLLGELDGFRCKGLTEVFGHQGISPKIEPPHSLPAGVMDPKRFGVLDDGPWRGKAAGRHF